MPVTNLYMESIDGIQPLDVLAVFAHPGEAEWSCGGTLRKFALAGKRVGIVDLSAGEAGSFGTADQRLEEATAAGQILGLAFRGCRKFPDGRLENTLSARMTVIADLRRLRPALVILPYGEAAHPDMRVASEMVSDACHLCGIGKLDDDTPPHRPKRILYAVPASVTPSFVVDVTAELDTKIQALFAHRTQMTGREELARERILAEASTHGARAGLRYGEGFMTKDPLAITDPAGFLL